MFKKLSALLLVLPVISALQLNQPTTEVRSETSLTITWTTSSGDPATFDLYLTNDNFRNTFALKNVVTTADGSITVVIPVVPAGPGYTLQASPIGDVTTTLSETSAFEIGEHISSSSLSSSTSSRTGTSTSISGGPPSLSTSGLGSTISRTSTPGVSGLSTGSSSSPSTTPTGSFNGGSNGALGVTGIGATVVGVLVAAGAFLAF